MGTDIAPYISGKSMDIKRNSEIEAKASDNNATADMLPERGSCSIGIAIVIDDQQAP